MQPGKVIYTDPQLQHNYEPQYVDQIAFPGAGPIPAEEQTVAICGPQPNM